MTEAQYVYPINESLGSCIIFNMKDFKKRRAKSRDGTQYDCDMIKKTFTKFGYVVYTAENPTTKQIQEKMSEVLGKDNSKSSSFVCFILSHGSTENMISTFDGQMNLNDIIQMTDVPHLQGKPKIFGIQACRGGNTDSGMDESMYVDIHKSTFEVDDMNLFPRNPDLLLIFATPPGYVSGRNPKTGSAFIQLLCQLLEQERDTATVCVLLHRLTMAISNIPIRFKDEEGLFLQVPYFMSTLRKSLMLLNSTSGGIQFETTSIIKDTQAELSKRRNRVFRNNFDSGNNAYQFLLKETHGCYDVSISTARHCLVINTTTRVNERKATEDLTKIMGKMNALKFEVSTASLENWKDKLKCCTKRDSIGCLFCFIQIDSDDDTYDTTFVAEVIETVKMERHMLNKPKVYIIQPYQTAAVFSSDTPSDDDIRRYPIKHSKESDVLMIHVLPVKYGKTSFIEIFCKEYDVKNAGQVPIMGFLDRILPGKHESEWISLQPIVCSTMRKHLMMKDHFDSASYQPEFFKPIEVVLDVVDGIRNLFR